MADQQPKINYRQISDQFLATLDLSQGKPSLLLHACCAPCSAFPLEYLTPYFRVTIYYNNSNIYPQAEYDRRLAELRRYLEEIAPQLTEPVSLIVPPYRNEEYTRQLEPLRNVAEGGERCFLCYALRMEEGFRYARDHGFDYFTTVMTVSRQKNSQKLNEIGARLAQQYPQVRYFHSDFKKKRGIERGQQLAAQHGLYRQDYCGCLYSWQQRQLRRAHQDTERSLSEKTENPLPLAYPEASKNR